MTKKLEFLLKKIKKEDLSNYIDPEYLEGWEIGEIFYKDEWGYPEIIENLNEFCKEFKEGKNKKLTNYEIINNLKIFENTRIYKII